VASRAAGSEADVEPEQFIPSTCGPPAAAAPPGVNMPLLDRQVALNVLNYMQARLAPTIVGTTEGVQVVKPGALTGDEELLHQAALRFLAAQLKAGTPAEPVDITT
jgi:hypothetical protein